MSFLPLSNGQPKLKAIQKAKAGSLLFLPLMMMAFSSVWASSIPVVDASAPVTQPGQQANPNHSLPSSSQNQPTYRGSAPRSTYSSNPSYADTDAPGQKKLGTGAGDLIYQIELLQQEIATLRGMLEVQSRELAKLKQEQQARYLDLDSRLSRALGGSAPANLGSSLTGSGIASGTVSAATSSSGDASSNAPSLPPASQVNTNLPALPPAAVPPQTAANTSQQPPSAVASLAAEPRSAKEAYTQAKGKLRNRDYQGAQKSFAHLIKKYPSSHYTANSFYWLGEVSLLLGNAEQARQSFSQVLNLYPDHAKAPDSLFKLGVSYHRLGNNEKAAQTLQEVLALYASSSIASRAKDYLRTQLKQ